MKRGQRFLDMVARIEEAYVGQEMPTVLCSSSPVMALLCGACENGRPEDCSGWCGIEPPAWVGPVQPWVWDELRELGCDVDPWEDSAKAKGDGNG